MPPHAVQIFVLDDDLLDVARKLEDCFKGNTHHEVKICDCVMSNYSGSVSAFRDHYGTCQKVKFKQHYQTPTQIQTHNWTSNKLESHSQHSECNTTKSDVVVILGHSGVVNMLLTESADYLVSLFLRLNQQ